jgi:hypothetical protein
MSEIPKHVMDKARELCATVAESDSAYILLGVEITCDNSCCRDGFPHHRLILATIKK